MQFFFFKQKTAYEMRISDWSSDVCSSDLLVSELVQSADLQAKPEQVRTRIEEFAQNYEQPAQVVAYYLSDRQRRAEIEAIVLEDNVVDHVLSKAQRSEEHTSELQSLMRISYAVFCLKKNKTRNKQP